MKLLLAFFNNRSIQFKILVYFVLLIIIPILVLGVLGNVIYRNSIESEINNHTIQMIDQVKKITESYIKDMENIAYFLSRDLYVMDFLREKGYSRDNRFKDEYTIKRLLSTYTAAHPEIAGILIVNENDVCISNEMFRIAREPLTAEDWYKEAAQDFNNVQLISNPIGRNISNNSSYSAEDVVSVVKAIYDTDSKRVLGVVLIDLKLDIIKKAIEDIKLGKSGFVYILDADDEIVYAPINKIVYRVKASWVQDNNKNSVVKIIGNNRYQIMYKDSFYTGWKTIGVFSLNETLKEVIRIRDYSFIIAIMTLILASFVAFFFTKSIVKPISKLRGLMKRAEVGDLDVRFKSKFNDEIGQLGNSFNNMISEIKKLIGLVYIEQKSKREAELKTLQAQIKPHFLYNTLDTIQWMAQDQGADDIIEIVAALTSLFRISLNEGRELVSVRKELEHVRSYLIIQMARYEDKLEYEINYDESILDYKVIKLILQPIVENAIYHGIKSKRGKGKLIVDARISEGKLCFSVTDNGIGIPPERLEEINSILGRESHGKDTPGYGIFNISERIRLRFGSGYGLKFYSKYGEGTKVEIWHPMSER